MSGGTSKKRRKAREKRAASLKFQVPEASKGQHIEASTKLKCSNVTNKSIFIEGLQDAGVEAAPRRSSDGKDPNRAVIAVQSQEVAHQIVKALDGFSLQGRRMHIEITVRGTQIGSAKERLPKKKFLHQCVINAFIKRGSKKSGALEGPENAVATQKARTDINVAEVAIKEAEVDDDLMAEKGEAGAMGVLDSERDKSEGLHEQMIKQENEEERANTRDDSIRPEISTTQEMKAAETRSGRRGEKHEIQDTARMGTPTRSPTPNDILSALYASLV